MQTEHDAGTSGGPPDLYWDPFDTAIDTDPYECWRRLRDEAPVYRNDRYDFYALSRSPTSRPPAATPSRSRPPTAPSSS